MPALSLAASRPIGAAGALTTPLLPDDDLSLLNPLWSTRALRGRVEAVHPETDDATRCASVRTGVGGPIAPASTSASGSRSTASVTGAAIR